MKKYTIELSKEQLEQLGLKVPKFELSKEFWKGRDTYSVSNLGFIKTSVGFHQNINDCKYESELPTHPLAEAYKVWTRLMLIQYEMNGGEVLEKGYAVYSSMFGISASNLPNRYGIKFKTKELAEQFLEENREDLERIQIMGF